MNAAFGFDAAPCSIALVLYKSATQEKPDSSNAAQDKRKNIL